MSNKRVAIRINVVGAVCRGSLKAKDKSREGRWKVNVFNPGNKGVCDKALKKGGAIQQT